MPKVTQYTTEENLIIKKPLPHVGIVCSNPRRVERIVKAHLENSVLLTEYQSAWQLDIYTGNYNGKSVFVAALAVGAAGAAFAIQQLAAAGAKYIIRYGSNDAPGLTIDRMGEIIIVDRADNLYGLMQSSGAPSETWGKALQASPSLIQALQTRSRELNLTTKLAICHHVEDYGAYAFPEKAGEFSDNVSRQIRELESRDAFRLHSRDMETAALFYRAELDGFHAATVLQNIPKFRGAHQTYDGAQGNKAKEMEDKFCHLIFSTLASFAQDYKPDFRSYWLLNEGTVVNYLATLPVFAGQFSLANTYVQLIQSNVFRVTDFLTNKSIIVKQEVHTSNNDLSHLGNYLSIARRQSPTHVPELFYADSKTMRVVVISDLRKHSTLETGLESSIRYPNYVSHVADFLANTLFHTSRFSMDQATHSELIQKFQLNPMRGVIEKSVYDELKPNASLAFKQQREHLRYILSTRFEALVHGDLRAKSILVNQDETYVIDGEFSFVGPISFDLGKLVGNLITIWLPHFVKASNLEFQQWLLNSVKRIWNDFHKDFSSLWKQNRPADFSLQEFELYQQGYFENILHETIGFAGLEVYRCACKHTIGVGLSSELRTSAEQLASIIGQTMVEKHNKYADIFSVMEYIESIERTTATSSSQSPMISVSYSQ